MAEKTPELTREALRKGSQGALNTKKLRFVTVLRSDLVHGLGEAEAAKVIESFDKNQQGKTVKVRPLDVIEACDRAGRKPGTPANKPEPPPAA